MDAVPILNRVSARRAPGSRDPPSQSLRPTRCRRRRRPPPSARRLPSPLPMLRSPTLWRTPSLRPTAHSAYSGVCPTRRSWLDERHDPRPTAISTPTTRPISASPPVSNRSTSPRATSPPRERDAADRRVGEVDGHHLAGLVAQEADRLHAALKTSRSTGITSIACVGDSLMRALKPLFPGVISKTAPQLVAFVTAGERLQSSAVGVYGCARRYRVVLPSIDFSSNWSGDRKSPRTRPAT